MTKEQLEFESKYQYKVVRPKGNHFKFLTIKDYIVTSSLLNYEDNGKTTIFAIKALDYNLENKHWITIKIAAEEFEKCMADFEIIQDGYEKYVKPVILDEVCTSWENQQDGCWLARFSSFIFPEKTGYHKIPIGEIKRDIKAGTDEYMFIYKSILDIDRPSCYIIPIPNFEFREDIEEYVKSFRQDILDNKVAYGLNRALLERTKLN